MRIRTAAVTALTLLSLGCATDPLGDAVEETGIDGPFEQVPEEGKFDGTSARGPSDPGRSATAVWDIDNAWGDVDAEAGIAWDADSGLDWEEKYDAWIAAMTTEDRLHGSGQTFVMMTPYGGRSFHAPTLECAEVALMLRATFAAWYHLPFFLQGWDASTRQTFFAGHFGFINRSGARAGRFPSFRSNYRDYTGDWAPGDAWPTDARLRSRRLGDDDGMNFLTEDGSEVGAGAYFDEIFLNKRVGHFMRLLLLYFGSANLADGANMFHVRPEATAAGDLLVKRWQRRGIGHVMPIFRVERHAEDAIEVTIASGSMPRREPVWEEPNRARSSFTSNYGGGTGETSDGDLYASLGGGVRRWRTARLSGGRWRNEVSPRDRDAYINDRDFDAVGARPARFGEILRTLSDEERRDVALVAIDAAREHLRNYPASCAARIRREDAFDDLYEVLGATGMSSAEIDANYRTLEDYVFAALVYEQSRTCCWNRSTGEMHGVIMAYAQTEQMEAEAMEMCIQPTVFRAETDGYARWQTHAMTMGASWNAWSEDESCAQRDVAEDTVDTMRNGAGWCSLGEPTTTEPTDPPVAGNGCDSAGSSTQDSAPRVGRASPRMAEVCAGEEDWFLIDATGSVTVRIDFAHADGDLDMEAVAMDGAVLDSSTSVQDTEEVTADGPFYIRVYGYDGAANPYTILAQ